MDNKRYCDPELARAHIVIQKLDETFSPMEALEKGTLFPELYCPYKYREHKYENHRRGERQYDGQQE